MGALEGTATGHKWWRGSLVVLAVVAMKIPVHAETPTHATSEGESTTARKARPATGEPISATTPRSPEEAAYLSLTPLANTNTMKLDLGYTVIPDDGNAAAAFLRTGLWMPYVLIPGIALPNMGSVVVFDVRYQTLDLPELPERVTGLTDITLVDQAVYRLPWGAIGLGPGFIFPAATSPELGQGKLQVGPVATIALSAVRGLIVTLAVSNAFSVAGSPERPDVNMLFVAPTIGLMLPKAFYVYADPLWRFDWKRDGHATLPINIAIGHAFTSHFVVYLQPEWIATGDLKNSVSTRIILSHLGW